MKSRNELIAHPIRLRVFGALAGRQLSTDQLADLLDDIPKPSLYRHIALLIEGGLLRVVAEEGKRRRIIAIADSGLLDRNAINSSSIAKNERLVGAFLTTMLSVYSAAVKDPTVTPGDWSLIGLRAYLTPYEERDLRSQIFQLLQKASEQTPAPGRTRRALFSGFLPDRDLPTENKP